MEPVDGGNVQPESQHPVIRDEASKLIRARYAAQVSFVDAQIGRVLADLEASGVAKETMVVLWSDHGLLVGEGNLWGKSATSTRAHHVPLLFRVPGVTPRRIS